MMTWAPLPIGQIHLLTPTVSASLEESGVIQPSTRLHSVQTPTVLFIGIHSVNHSTPNRKKKL